MGLKKNTSELINLINTKIINLDFPETPSLLYQPVKYILGNKGKRLRPILFLHAIQLFSDLKEIHFIPAIGLEIFHNFTLIHDDIMDKADIRRHQPTIHKKWDENVAILSGDAAMILATKQFLSLPEKIFKPVITEFNKMALEICEGQQYDMDFESRQSVSVSEYLEMIRLKTAVFLASALKMGAIAGNATTNQQQQLYEAGINFGLAFQLQDDFLDSFSNLEIFGKKPGGDILEKKKTFLLINAFTKSSEKQKKELSALLDNTQISPDEKITAVKKIYTDLSIDKLTKTAIKDYYTKGFLWLNKINGYQAVKEELISFFQEMQQRIS